MPSIVDLLRDEAETTFNAGAEDEPVMVWIRYSPSKHTPALEARCINIQEEAGQPSMAVAVMIEELLLAWDLKGDVEFEYTFAEAEEGEEPVSFPVIGSGKVVVAEIPFPIEAVKLAYLPTEFLTKILEAVGEHARSGSRQGPSMNRAARRRLS